MAQQLCGCCAENSEKYAAPCTIIRSFQSCVTQQREAGNEWGFLCIPQNAVVGAQFSKHLQPSRRRTTRGENCVSSISSSLEHRGNEEACTHSTASNLAQLALTTEAEQVNTGEPDHPVHPASPGAVFVFCFFSSLRHEKKNPQWQSVADFCAQAMAKC